MSELENKNLEQSESGNTQVEQVDNTTYIEAIKEMRMNTVDKKTHEALKEENQKLLRALINGETIEQEVESKPKNLNEIMKRFREADTTLEGVTAALEYRDEVLRLGGDDPFLPGNDRVKKILPTEEDIATANRVAEGFKHCVEYAEGDPVIFANELSRITIDSAPMAAKKRR